MTGSGDVRSTMLRDLVLLIVVPLAVTGGLAIWLVPWGRFMREFNIVPYVPAGGDVFAAAAGTWGWAGAEDRCGEDAHVIEFAPDRSVMAITHMKPVGDSAGAQKRTWEYEILGSDSSRIRGAIRGEDRLTDGGDPVVWDLVMTGPDEYRWHRTDWADDGYTGAVERCPAPPSAASGPDRGVGVAYLAADQRDGPRAPRESLLVYAGQRRGEVAAVFLRVDEGNGGWSYALTLPGGQRAGTLEFDYEIDGIPIDEMSRDSAWARVLLVTDTLGVPAAGWVELDPARVGVALWREHLAAREWLFFADSVPPPVYATPGGAALDPDSVFTGDRSYSLYREDVSGDWMQVRIVSPDDSCGSEVESPRVTRAWVRYLDPRGRPRLWYYTRGC